MPDSRIVIFEDSKHLRESLQIVLNGTPGFICTGAYHNCSDLLHRIEKDRPDTVLMDIEMPGMNGIEATRIIKASFPDVHVLIQTVFSEDAYIFDAICAGASGYILKTTSLTGYIEALQNVSSGGSPMTPGIARRVMELFRANMPERPTTEKVELTAKETAVLQQLVTGKSYKMIAAAMDLSLDTIKTHIRNIYLKLQVNSNTEAVARALRDKLV
ncbi:response regulator transcription factor [Paraflavitalea pollutisoli]|uniref:response regulator transcription factor n=1 Tax=Paraflavitalea pollutisoli TaxID=3034143 RepID=UPI0023ED7963|nr:response regulator transcription factor [Paraflavitalea sp. H1-2-19X]